MKMHAHTCTHTYSSEQALSDKRGLGASWGIEGERRGRLESHFQSEREAPHMTTGIAQLYTVTDQLCSVHQTAFH